MARWTSDCMGHAGNIIFVLPAGLVLSGVYCLVHRYGSTSGLFGPAGGLIQHADG